MADHLGRELVQRCGWFGFANRRQTNNVTVDDFVTPGESYAESVFIQFPYCNHSQLLKIEWDAILSYQFMTRRLS